MAGKKGKAKTPKGKEAQAEETVSEESPAIEDQAPAQEPLAKEPLMEQESIQDPSEGMEQLESMPSESMVEGVGGLDSPYDFSESEMSFDQEETHAGEQESYVSESSFMNPEIGAEQGGSFGLEDSTESAEEEYKGSEYPDSNSSDDLLEKVREIQDYINENKQSVAIGVVVVLLLLYFILGGAGKKDVGQQMTVASETTLAELEQRESALETELKSFESQFQDFSAREEHQITDLASKVNLLFESAKSTKQELIKHSRQLEQTNKTIRNMIAERSKQKAQAKRKREGALYTVNAIVPGRVWLKSVNGHEFTASVGDRLEGYGSILKIEADYGRVLTSSGKVIYLGRDDG